VAAPRRHPPALIRLKARAPFYAYRAASAIARGLPVGAAESLASGTGALLSRTMKGRRRIVERNLQRINGSPLSERALQRGVAEAFHSYAMYWMESFRLPDLTAEDLDRHMTYDGYERIVDAVAGGHGLIVALPHLGGWDYGGAWLATKGYPATVVVEALDPPELFEWFADFRRSLGLTIVPHGREAGTAVLRALRQGGVVGLVADRDLEGNGVEVTFFGEKTTLPGGPATLALRTGAVILPAAIYFEGKRHHRGVVLPPIDTTRSGGSLRDDVARITQDLATALEELIRRAPEQWHLMQPNWPSDRAHVKEAASG
jgi:KDO2-lipid IV(A) lauroyltransferase